jgi:hypothetical protein
VKNSTVGYAIGTIAAAAFGAILYTVVTGDSIVSALKLNQAMNDYRAELRAASEAAKECGITTDQWRAIVSTY